MALETQPAPGMSSRAAYRIVVKGVLTERWGEMFNGTAVSVEGSHGGKPCTTLTCRVRDQAELLGILNRLNGLCLPLLQVTVISKEGE
jgi:hypothetical protein